MKPAQFLQNWKSENINSGTQQADALKLVENLLADAEKEDIGRDMLAQAAGGGLSNMSSALSERRSRRSFDNRASWGKHWLRIVDRCEHSYVS